LPRRILRLAKAAAAISLASAPLVGLSVPALAGSATPVAPRYEWWLRTLNVAQAWRSAAGAGVTVAVLSDGVMPDEGYLAGSVIQGPDFTKPGRSARSPYFALMGTSLAGLIAGHGDSNYANQAVRPVVGVAPAAKVLSIRVTLSPGDPLWSDSKVTARLPDAIAAGIRYAIAHGASIIDLPADPGVPDPAIASGASAAAGGSPAERAAVAYAVRHDVVLVAPAGDNGRTGDARNYPAAYPGVMAIGAFGPSFVKAPFSSRQSYVALTAAGEHVTAAGRNGFTDLNSTYASSAIVAGIAALIKSEFPNLTADQIRKSMTDSTVFGHANSSLGGSGYGTVNAEHAVLSAATMSPPHARPAMLGAQPRNRPVSPPIQGSGSIIMHQLNGDAAFSAVLLALLLVPIALYGVAARRRDQQEALLAAERQQTVRATSGHGSMLADPLLEFFGPQHARPATPQAAMRPPPPAPRFAPRPGLTGRSTMSAPRTAPQASPSPADAQPSRAAVSRPVTERATSSGIGAGPIVRQAQVSGSPPWAPAARPTSDLPWAVVAPPPGAARSAGLDAPTVPPPPDHVWNSPVSARPAAAGPPPAATARPPAPASRPSPPAPPAPPAPTARRPPAAAARPPVVNQRSAPPRSLFEPLPAPTPEAPAAAPQPAPQPAAPQPAPQPAPTIQGDAESQPTSWQDLPRRVPDKSARRREAGSKQPDDERGPIFVWTPMGSTDRQE
jgi:Subtilase family